MNSTDLDEYRNELQTIWDALVRRDEMPPHADAIVVGGCTNLGLAERAAELYHAGVSELIIITGYQPKTMDMTEAKYLSDRCVALGVPRTALVLEEEATNTGQNITFASNLLKTLKNNVKTVILIHKPYMALRFLATAEAQWPKPQPDFYITCQTISFEEYCTIYGLEDTAWKMLGDLKRMKEYVAKGFQTPQTIPQAAMDAYTKIVDSGFVTR